MPSPGDSLVVISAAKLAGRFDAISADGFKFTPTYGANSLTLRIDN